MASNKNPYKRAELAKRVPPTAPKHEEPTVAPVVEEVTPEPAPVVTEAPVVQPAASASLADMIEQKPEGKSCGFYLSSEAIKKLDKAAKQLKCSKSKALDLLIRKYL